MNTLLQRLMAWFLPIGSLPGYSDDALLSHATYPLRPVSASALTLLLTVAGCGGGGGEGVAETPPPSTLTPSPAVPSEIDLGGYGKLIAPVNLEGKWYYYWDRSGDGTTDNIGPLNGGFDNTTHDVLDALFNHDINGATNTTVQNKDGKYGTTNIYRYATLNGVKLALPTYGSTVNASGQASALVPHHGTPVSDGVTTNATYDGLLAIWDAHNGAETGLHINGTPPGWRANYYWSATPSWSGHASVYLNSGGAGDHNDIDGFVVGHYVALEVL